MSRVEELENEIKGLENSKIALLKELEIEKQKTNLEYPPLKLNQYYWFINGEGLDFRTKWDADGFDKRRSEIGNVFVTREEAVKEIDRLSLLTRFRQFRNKCNGDWKPQLREMKYYIFLNCTDFNCSVSYDTVCNAFNLFGYFKHKTDCKRAIELFGDEIKRLFVEE
ncbi:hypothetical protein ACWOA2_07725 [Granulicatella elegans]